MVNKQLLDFIKQQIDKGTSKEEIKNMLLTNSWTSQDVEEGFSIVSNHSSQEPQLTSSSVAPSITTEITKLLGVFKLLKESWQIYREKFITITGIMVVPVILSFLGNTALSQKETNNVLFIIGIIVSLASFFFGLLIIPALIFSVKEEIGMHHV